MLDVPRVRLEMRRAYYAQDVRGEADWPVPGTTTLRLYLDATHGVLAETPARHESSVAYSAPRTGGSDERAVFAIRFEHDTEVTGGMRLRLWIAAC